MIVYKDSTDGITEEALFGFFEGWPNPPSNKQFLRVLKNSSYVVLAIDQKTQNVVGFINAVSDQVLTAYIPLLEVLPEYRGRGIGKELTEQMLEKLRDYYMIDLICNPDLEPFYSKMGMKRSMGMMLRNYRNQSGIGGVKIFE